MKTGIHWLDTDWPDDPFYPVDSYSWHVIRLGRAVDELKVAIWDAAKASLLLRMLFSWLGPERMEADE